jgi:hypothetical protein
VDQWELPAPVGQAPAPEKLQQVPLQQVPLQQVPLQQRLAQLLVPGPQRRLLEDRASCLASPQWLLSEAWSLSRGTRRGSRGLVMGGDVL